MKFFGLKATQVRSWVCVLLTGMALNAWAQLAPVSFSEADGFLDVDIPIVDANTSAGGVIAIQAKGVVATQTVGFALDILPGWKESGPRNARFVLTWGRIRIRSLGPSSNAFLSVIATKYGFPQKPLTMAAQLEVPAVCLGCNPDTDILKPLHMKAFFEGKREDDYAEVYLNVTSDSKRLEFHEKDSGYRLALLRALTQK